MPEDARIKTTFPHHPKTKKLRRRLRERGVCALVCLWLWAVDNRPDGNLVGLTDEDIELAALWEYPDDEAVGVLVSALVELGFLDGEPKQRFLHDWAEHNPYVAARPERIARSRDAALARWEGTTGEQRSAAAKNAAAGRWKFSKESQSGGVECVPDSCSVRADSTHDACESHASCVPPSLPLPSTPKPPATAGIKNLEFRKQSQNTDQGTPRDFPAETYAHKVIETFHLSDMRNNVQAIASAIRAMAGEKACSRAEAVDALIEVSTRARAAGVPIDYLFFMNCGWRKFEAAQAKALQPKRRSKSPEEQLAEQEETVRRRKAEKKAAQAAGQVAGGAHAVAQLQ